MGRTPDLNMPETSWNRSNVSKLCPLSTFETLTELLQSNFLGSPILISGLSPACAQSRKCRVQLYRGALAGKTTTFPSAPLTGASRMDPKAKTIFERSSTAWDSTTARSWL